MADHMDIGDGLGATCSVTDCPRIPTHWGEVTPEGSVPHIKVVLCGNDMLPDLPDTPLILPADLNFGDDD